MHARLINEYGSVKEVKVGFSWTTFFFGCLVPLVRLDFFYFIIFFVIDIILSVLTFVIGAVIFDLIVCFKYNKWYTHRLLRKGFVPASEIDAAVFESRGYL